MMRENGIAPDRFFFDNRNGRASGDSEFARLAAEYKVVGGDHPLRREDGPPSLVIEEVEHLWSAIDEADDWAPLTETITAIRRLGDALGEPPAPAGHAA